MQTNYLYSSYSGLSISTPVVTSQFLSLQIKVIYIFSLSYPHSYQSIPLLSEIPDNNSVLLKYATTCATVDRGTVHELRPRLFPTFVVNSLPFRSNSTPTPHVPDRRQLTKLGQPLRWEPTWSLGLSLGCPLTCTLDHPWVPTCVLMLSGNSTHIPTTPLMCAYHSSSVWEIPQEL